MNLTKPRQVDTGEVTTTGRALGRIRSGVREISADIGCGESTVRALIAHPPDPPLPVWRRPLRVGWLFRASCRTGSCSGVSNRPRRPLFRRMTCRKALRTRPGTLRASLTR